MPNMEPIDVGDRNDQRRSRRFRELVDAVGERRGRPLGWKRDVARQLDISQGHLSRVINGRRPPSDHLVMKAAEEFNIDREFFDSEGPPEDWYLAEYRNPVGTLVETDEGPSLASDRELLLRLAADIRRDYESNKEGSSEAPNQSDAATFLARLLTKRQLAVVQRAHAFLESSEDEQPLHAMRLAVAVEELLDQTSRRI